MSRALPDPIYYMGWIIQPVQGGYIVYTREDRSYYDKRQHPWFRSLEDATRYVNGQLSKGE